MDEEQGVPSAVRVVRDFVNTYEPQVDEESIRSPERLTDWCVASGLLEPGVEFTDRDVARAVSVREGLRQVLLEHAGHEGDAATVRALNDELAAAPVSVELGADGPGFRPADGTAWAAALSGLLEAVRTSTEDGTWRRLKVCARDTCRWAYYDASRNQARRWCSMAGCGNQAKMKRAYAARKERARNGGSGDGAAS